MLIHACDRYILDTKMTLEKEIKTTLATSIDYNARHAKHLWCCILSLQNRWVLSYPCLVQFWLTAQFRVAVNTSLHQPSATSPALEVPLQHYE